MKTEELFEKAEIIVDEYFHEFTEGRLERDQMIDAIWKLAEQYHEARMKEELIEAFNWLSDKDSPYVPLYDEYNEKGIRFVTNEADFTSEQVVNSYLASRKQLTPPKD